MKRGIAVADRTTTTNEFQSVPSACKSGEIILIMEGSAQITLNKLKINNVFFCNSCLNLNSPFFSAKVYP